MPISKFQNAVTSVLTRETVFIPIFFALGLTLFWGTLQVGYFGDDFNFLRIEGPWWRAFTEANQAGFLRPIEAVLIYSSQSAWGDNPFFLHTVNLLGHVAYSITTFYLCVIFTANREASLLAACFTLISQAAVYPLGNIDTISQVFASLFGLLSIVLICLAVQKSHMGKIYCLGLIVFVFAMLSKEGAAGYVPVLFLVTVYQVWQIPNETNRQKMLRALRFFLPVALIFLTYFFLYRASIVNEITSERYSLSIGLNIIKNFGLVSAGLFLLFSKFDLVLALHNQSYFAVAFYIVISALFWVVVYVGLRVFTERSGWASPLFFLLLSYIVLSPTLLTQRVGELYLYASLPFLYAIVGMGIWSLFFTQGRSLGRAMALAAGLILVIVNVTAINSKVAHMVRESTTSTAFYTGIENSLSMYLRAKEVFVLDKTNDTEPYYSAFSRPTHSLFGNARNFLVSQHPRLPSMRLISESELISDQSKYASSVVLTLTPNKLLECGDPFLSRDCKVLSQVPWNWYKPVFPK